MKYCFALDLKDDPVLIEIYKEYHKKVWPEIEKSMRLSGILNLEIYCVQNRLFMILDVDVSFSFEAKDKLDKENTKVQEWETLMSLKSNEDQLIWNLRQQFKTLGIISLNFVPGRIAMKPGAAWMAAGPETELQAHVNMLEGGAKENR